MQYTNGIHIRYIRVNGRVSLNLFERFQLSYHKYCFENMDSPANATDNCVCLVNDFKRFQCFCDQSLNLSPEYLAQIKPQFVKWRIRFDSIFVTYRACVYVYVCVVGVIVGSGRIAFQRPPNRNESGGNGGSECVK